MGSGSGIDEQPEHDEPDESEELKWSITQDEVGRRAVLLPDDEQLEIAQQRDRNGEDREVERRAVEAATCVVRDGELGVEDECCRAEHAERLIDVIERVPDERSPAGNEFALEVAAPLAEREEQGEQTGAQDDPRRGHGVNGVGAGDEPQDETGGDDDDVDKRVVLEPRRIGDIHEEVSADRSRDLPTEPRPTDDRSGDDDEHDRQPDRVTDRQLP